MGRFRKLPDDIPTSFVKKRWKEVVFKGKEIDRRYYELCLLSELKNVLRSGDVWIEGSRQFKDFNTYLIPFEKFTELKQNQALPQMDCTQYLNERLELLEKRLAHINKLAAEDALPDATITETSLKITPIETSVPKNAKPFVDKAAALLPRIKITELLLEVDQWTNFTEHFTHLKSNEMAEDKTLLLTAILADGINLGLSKMSESCPGVTYSKLSWLQDWHICDETYSAALAALTNAQLKQPFASHWGDGTTSSLAPRIRNLSEIKLFTPPKQNKNYTALQTMISSEEINVNRIKKCGMKFNVWRFQFNKVLRLHRCCYENSAITHVKMV